MIKYMLSDGHGQYLRRDISGNFVPVKNRALGDIWEQRNKVCNVLSNCVNKNLRSRYKIIYFESEEKEEVKHKPDTSIKSKDNIAKNIVNEAIEESRLDKLTSDINMLSDFVQSAEERRELLISSLSDVDKEISDINHYIEFGKFNAYQGWLAFNMLKHRLKKRRKIKDELQILTQLGECKVNSSMLEDIKASIGNLNSREYQPRILKELFE